MHKSHSEFKWLFLSCNQTYLMCTVKTGLRSRKELGITRYCDFASHVILSFKVLRHNGNLNTMSIFRGLSWLLQWEVCWWSVPCKLHNLSIKLLSGFVRTACTRSLCVPCTGCCNNHYVLWALQTPTDPTSLLALILDFCQLHLDLHFILFASRLFFPPNLVLNITFRSTKVGLFVSGFGWKDCWQLFCFS